VQGLEIVGSGFDNLNVSLLVRESRPGISRVPLVRSVPSIANCVIVADSTPAVDCRRARTSG
jgi:hypothetical protein